MCVTGIFALDLNESKRFWNPNPCVFVGPNECIAVLKTGLKHHLMLQSSI